MLAVRRALHDDTMPEVYARNGMTEPQRVDMRSLIAKARV